MHTKISAATTLGINAYLVDVEVDLSLGMLQFFIVGLPDTAIKESKQRIVTALKNCGVKLPERKITVNLAPADLKKEGTLFDLPVAVGILQAARVITLPQDFLQETIIIGELSLDGTIKPVNGVLPIACDAAKLGKKRIIVPQKNAREAALCTTIEVQGVEHITQVISYARQETVLPVTISDQVLLSDTKQISNQQLDFSQVKGNTQAKRALQIAAAGHHNILFIGSPGSGKSMLAERLPTIMPPLSFNEILETTKLYSISGKLINKDVITKRPFRNPHHSISQAGLVGGGSFPQPGEISLAHNGILFLDELTEFSKSTLEGLRQPLESKQVCIARAQHTITFPSSFLLVGAFNPCPCGYFGDRHKKCACTAQQISTYLGRLSGPLLDRIDIQVLVQTLDYTSIVTKQSPTTSQELHEKVIRAVTYQKNRQQEKSSGHLTAQDIEKYCIVTSKGQELLKLAFERLQLSMRGYHKVLKVARTIADLEEHEYITHEHIQEALSYRSLEQTKEKIHH